MITRNPLLAEARGGLGKVVVFKQMYGKTVMTNYPRKVTIPREQQSAAQRSTRDNFRNAAAYAKHVLKDPVQKAYYEKRKSKLRLYSAYQAAITDYMRQLKKEPTSKKASQEQIQALRSNEGVQVTYAYHSPLCRDLFERRRETLRVRRPWKTAYCWLQPKPARHAARVPRGYLSFSITGLNPVLPFKMLHADEENTAAEIYRIQEP